MNPLQMSQAALVESVGVAHAGVQGDAIQVAKANTSSKWSQSSLATDNPQLKRCIEISQLCVDAQHKRPTADEIMGWLNEMETAEQMIRPAFGHSSSNTSRPSSSSQEQVNSGSTQPQPHRKTSWPECVGMLATQAYEQIYRDCWPDVAVEVHPPGSHIFRVSTPSVSVFSSTNMVQS